MANFEQAYEETIRAEGGYKLTNISGDRGGQTYAGIARNMNPTWAGWTYVDAGKVPPTAQVRDFYKREFWDAVRGDSIDSQVVAATIYDFAVNAGVRVAVKLAQIVVGATPDGDFGPATLTAVNMVDPPTFRLAYALAKVKRYAEIVNRDRGQGKFLLGWINRTLGSLT